jgi:16S rRNA C967 or C1407 C5-methylase (RsmB/RsmF family)/NOL1/NOP2/fmu family ribosome biogenesis protein
MSYILPPSLVRRLGANPLFDLGAFVATHEAQTSVTSIRLHPHKWPSPEAAWDRVPWSQQGYYLPQRPVFTLDPFFHAGAYYVQEASSMFLEEIIRQLQLDAAPCKVLDLCAAPGGKTTLLNSALHPNSLLVANEIIKSRVNVLEDNVVRWGYPNTVVTHNDPNAFGKLQGFFDVMVVDAPCSGSGMFRKEPETIDEWSEGAVKLCSERQQRILAGSLATLKEEGYLIYSTCSYSEEENEEVLDWLITNYGLTSVKLHVPEDWGIWSTQSALHQAWGYRFYPHRLKGEGLFIAVLQKNTPQKCTTFRKKEPFKSKLDPLVNAWIQPKEPMFTFVQDETIHAFPQKWEEELQLLKQYLYIKRAGVALGKTIKNDLVPDHELALSLLLHPDVPSVTLDLAQAQAYLRKHPLDAQSFEGLPLGWCLVKYQHLPLGWVKTMAGQRINNYYPKEWRILHL